MLNWNLIAKRWKQLGIQTKSRWAKLTDEDLVEIDGSQEALTFKLQHHYGFLRLDAEKQVIEWGTKMDNLLSRPPEPIATNGANGVSNGANGANGASSGTNSASGVANGSSAPTRRPTLVEQEDSDEITNKVALPVEKHPESGSSQDAVPMDKVP